MSLLSISQIAALTGKDRRTVSKAIEHLDYQEGEKREHWYQSEDALAAVFLGGDVCSLDAARAEQAKEAALLSRVRREEIQRTRIPIELVEALWDGVIQGFSATLKASRGKTLNVAKINELISQLRDTKLPVKW